MADVFSDYLPGGAWLIAYARSVQPRRLGVRLNHLALDPRRAFDNQIEVTLFNIGGDKGGGVIGACIVTYTVARDGGTWIARWAAMMDP